jgi:hypothetical protein
MIQPQLLAVGPISATSDSGKPTFEDPYDQASEKKNPDTGRMFIDGQLPDAWRMKTNEDG